MRKLTDSLNKKDGLSDLPPIKVPLFELDFWSHGPLGQVAYTPKSYEVYTHYIGAYSGNCCY
jgi:hypothetical protein